MQAPSLPEQPQSAQSYRPGTPVEVPVSPQPTADTGLVTDPGIVSEETVTDPDSGVSTSPLQE
ncbi:hypothetical protein [Pseudonocardia lacus]|uniref:hypothetical protein n=1 Tax=Pseudonocardia lacus TaxID=2835865 RepID=UPI001BDC032D|nr:hypothetical protein [Pseudonocardia lacus]